MCTVLCWQANWGNPILRSTLPLISASLLGTRHKIHNFFMVWMYSSTCHERTPSGPGKSVRTLQVAARHRDGRAGGGTPNLIHLAILHNTITTSNIPNEYTHCHNHQTTARTFERSVGRKFGCAPAIFGWNDHRQRAFVCTVHYSRCLQPINDCPRPR